MTNGFSCNLQITMKESRKSLKKKKEITTFVLDKISILYLISVCLGFISV